MQKLIVCGILRRVRSDPEFTALWNGDSPEDILKVLREDGLNANGQLIAGSTVKDQDILDTQDVQWIIQALEQQANGSTPMGQLSRSSKVSTLASPVLSAAERRAESQLGLELQRGLVGVIKQIAEGYRYVMWMSNISFLMGVVLILMSAISSLVLGQDTSSYLLGGLGLAGIIGSLLFRPARDLQNSRANLAQLQAVYINWINDLHNWNRYWELVINQNVGPNRQPPPIEEIAKISSTLSGNARTMMELIEEYCELRGHRKEDKRTSPKMPKSGEGRCNAGSEHRK